MRCHTTKILIFVCSLASVSCADPDGDPRAGEPGSVGESKTPAELQAASAKASGWYKINPFSIEICQSPPTVIAHGGDGRSMYAAPCYANLGHGTYQPYVAFFSESTSKVNVDRIVVEKLRLGVESQDSSPYICNGGPYSHLNGKESIYCVGRAFSVNSKDPIRALWVLGALSLNGTIGRSVDNQWDWPF